jgi:hypothetical protein
MDFTKKHSFFILIRNYYYNSEKGEMAEWSNAVVLKSFVAQVSEGSNPSLSASNIHL